MVTFKGSIIGGVLLMDLEKSQSVVLLSDYDLEKVSGGKFEWGNLATDQKVTYGIGGCALVVACVGFVATVAKAVVRSAKDGIGAIKKFSSSVES